MTNEAILSLMDHLCNQARNAMHVAFGLMEFHPDSASRRSWQTCVSATRSSADRLLLTIHDMRELSGQAPAVEPVEEIDLALCVGETSSLLNPRRATEPPRSRWSEWRKVCGFCKTGRPWSNC